jgi:ophiobolin F synthase
MCRANCPRHNSWHQSLGNIQEESLLISEEPASGSSKKRQFSESDNASTVSSFQYREAMSVQTSVTTISNSDWCSPDNAVKWEKPCSSVIDSPVNYINSLPSKGVRLVLIEALNQWLQVPPHSLHTIETIVNQLHNASLILDDIEDNSQLRRGSPAVHTIFGPAQSINSANVMYVHAVKQARQLRNPRAADILLDELECLYLGQSWDLYWKFNLSCPNIGEYLNMVDNKTGVMFRMLLRLMQGENPGELNIDFSRLALLFGRFFQIRDDYMNLQSEDYSEQKGFCEDFDEGKFSYPIVRCMENHPDLGARILGIFRQRTMGLDQRLQCLSHRVKLYIVNSMKAVGCFVETLDCLKSLEAELEEEVQCLEKHIGTTNPMLRLLLATLTVKDLSA